MNLSTVSRMALILAHAIFQTLATFFDRWIQRPTIVLSTPAKDQNNKSFKPLSIATMTEAQIEEAEEILEAIHS